MKKNLFFIFVIIGMLVVPSSVFAKDYTFKIGNNSEWNKNNIETLSENLYQLWSEDYEDYIFDNKYILEFEDGDYDYSDISLQFYGNVEYHFGNGNYRLHSIGGEEEPLVLKGMGIENTKVFVNDFEFEGIYISFSDLTFNCENDSDSLFVYGNYTALKQYGLESSGLNFKNVVINYSNSLDHLAFSIVDDDYPNIMFFDNVSINGVDTINIDISNYFVIPGDKKYYVIKNSDFSKQNIIFESDESRGKHPVYFENTKLNRIYARNREVYIDCDSTFVNGIKRGSGTDGSEIFRESDYTIYEYITLPEYFENGKVVLETCKQKEIKINSKVSFADIKKEFGYELDNTWTMDPEGIIEIKDGSIVPLKIGSTKISKEIDGEIQTLKITVLDVEKQLPLINPQTGMSFLGIIIFISIIFGGSYLIRKKKYE